MARPSRWRRARLRLLPRRRESLDAWLYLAVNGLTHTRRWDRRVAMVSDLGKGAGWMLGSGVLAMGGGRRGRQAAVTAAVAMFAAIGLVQGPLKHWFRRRRPYRHRLAIVVGPAPTDSSFPSGHTAGSFAAATALAACYPRDRPLLLALAAGVGVSRVYLGHHFPSDVLAGAGLGWAMGTLCARCARRLLRRPDRSPRPAT